MDAVMTDEEQVEVNAIIERQEKAYRKKLKANRNKVFAIHGLRNLHDQIDALADRVKTKPGVKVDCRKGCSYCCNLRVEVKAPEVFILAKHLRSSLSSSQLDDLILRLKEHARKAAGLRIENFYLTCVLLKDGACSAYEARPTMCRKFLSLDVERCKIPDASVPEDSEMVLKSSALIYGVTQAYEKSGLPFQNHELGQALLIALTDPGCEDRWFKGEALFPEIPEATDLTDC